MLELNVYMPFHIILALTVLRPLDIMLALSYIMMPTQVPSWNTQFDLIALAMDKELTN